MKILVELRICILNLSLILLGRDRSSRKVENSDSDGLQNFKFHGYPHYYVNFVE
jgi:hypothetical protein